MDWEKEVSCIAWLMDFKGQKSLAIAILRETYNAIVTTINSTISKKTWQKNTIKVYLRCGQILAIGVQKRLVKKLSVSSLMFHSSAKVELNVNNIKKCVMILRRNYCMVKLMFYKVVVRDCG